MFKRLCCVMSIVVVLVLLVGTAVATDPTPTPDPTAGSSESADVVRVQFLGRASFLITAPDGTRLVTDPYRTLPYDFPLMTEADVVTMSHTHGDHSAFDLVRGDPVTVSIYDMEIKPAGMIDISGYYSRHGDYGRGTNEPNMVFVFQIGDVKLVHLGDFGFLDNEADYEALLDADVVFVPVGDAAGIPHEDIPAFLERINARTMVPMHWFVPGEVFTSGASLEDFLATVPETMKVIEVEELLVEPDMPVQIAIIEQRPLKE